ncbi:helix-turn-helix domain-containing protein [Clostridioides difficile]|nr:helix-turn-helix domain-containing protein [Clostridioides difficile]
MILNFGENLRRLRKERNLSQEQLSEMLNVSRQAISKWESNKTYPDIENLMLLRNIFNTMLDDLLFD